MSRNYYKTGLVTEPLHIQGMSPNHERGYNKFLFANSAFTLPYPDTDTLEKDLVYPALVIPTEGRLTVVAGMGGDKWQAIPNGTNIDITVEDFAITDFRGAAKEALVTPSVPIVGATHYLYICERFE